VATAHRILGDHAQHRHWVGITEALLGARAAGRDRDAGWAPTFDGLADLHASDPGAALVRLAADPDDAVWANPNVVMWLPWHAALWAEAAVLSAHPDAPEYLRRAAHAARANPIAMAMIERSAALLARDRTPLPELADRFAAARCPYQEARTRRLARIG